MELEGSSSFCLFSLQHFFHPADSTRHSHEPLTVYLPRTLALTRTALLARGPSGVSANGTRALTTRAVLGSAPSLPALRSSSALAVVLETVGAFDSGRVPFAITEGRLLTRALALVSAKGTCAPQRLAGARGSKSSSQPHGWRSKQCDVGD